MAQTKRACRSDDDDTCDHEQNGSRSGFHCALILRNARKRLTTAVRCSDWLGNALTLGARHAQRQDKKRAAHRKRGTALDLGEKDALAKPWRTDNPAAGGMRGAAGWKDHAPGQRMRGLGRWSRHGGPSGERLHRLREPPRCLTPQAQRRRWGPAKKRAIIPAVRCGDWLGMGPHPGGKPLPKARQKARRALKTWSGAEPMGEWRGHEAATRKPPAAGGTTGAVGWMTPAQDLLTKVAGQRRSLKRRLTRYRWPAWKGGGPKESERWRRELKGIPATTSHQTPGRWSHPPRPRP